MSVNVAIVGATGAGKSTMVKMLAGVYQPDSGQLVIDGQPAVLSNPAAAQAAGIAPSYATDLGMGGASPAASVAHAAMAIGASLCETVVCVHAQKQATGHAEARHGQVWNGTEEYEEPFGAVGAIPMHAAAAARHMHEYGTTSEQLAAVALACRRHAALNAAAAMRTPIGVADVLASRWVGQPYHLLDCCLSSDGAGAVGGPTPERARSMRKAPRHMPGLGPRHPGSIYEAPTRTTLGGARAASRAFGMAGITTADVDVAELYDCFTAIVVITLEDYGFCAKGEGGAFVEGGRIELGGALPVNTHGGLLSAGHVEGMQHITEAVKQLRGGEVEPERQVRGARVAVVSGHGAALGAHATLLLGRDPA